MSVCSFTTDAMALQQGLNNLQKWPFNPEECEVLCLKNTQKITPALYTIRGYQLKQVESLSYRGVDMDSRLTFNSHVYHITKQANGTQAFLQRNTNSFPRKIKASCYTTFVHHWRPSDTSCWLLLMPNCAEHPIFLTHF